MIEIKSFTFNPFQENTYILYNKEKQCLIFDPGNINDEEDSRLLSFIKTNKLEPIGLINTHCHIDHVLGNQLIHDAFNLELQAHEQEVPVLKSCEFASKMYGIPYRGSPEIAKFIKEGSEIELGKERLSVLLTPGHSPGSLCFYSESYGLVIGGDVLFYGSIGRTDLPGGDYNTLISSIKTQLFSLPDHVVVYPGHGPKTTIGFEKKSNPFLQ